MNRTGPTAGVAFAEAECGTAGSRFGVEQPAVMISDDVARIKKLRVTGRGIARSFPIPSRLVAAPRKGYQ
jgi:hypothetical protein